MNTALIELTTWNAWIDKINADRKAQKSKPWWPSRNQEYLDGKPLWEHVFKIWYNGRIKLPSIEDVYDERKELIKEIVRVFKNNPIRKMATRWGKFLDEGLQSAYLDERLTPIVIKKKPSLINIPAHVRHLLTRTGLVAFSKPVIVGAVATAVAAATPELSPYLNQLAPIIRDRMVFYGSTIAPVLMLMWNFWRYHVTASQKNKIKSIKQKLTALEAMRSQRAAKNSNLLLDKSIVKLEKELQKEMNAAFAKAYTHVLNMQNLS